MLDVYRPLLRIPGVRRFLPGTALAMCGGAMFGMGVVGMIAGRTGSYALAGAVSGAGLIVLAATAVVVGRLIDRYGQSRVTWPLLIWSTVWGLATAVVSVLDGPHWMLFAGYAASSVVATIGTMTRARWTHLLRDQPEMLHRAMSMEQVIEELTYVIGPALAVILSSALFPEAGFLAATACYAVGAAIFLSARHTEPPVQPDSHEGLGFAVLNPGVVLLTLVLTMTGSVFGSNEVVTLAVAQDAGHGGWAGVIVALFAVGSGGAGLYFGTRELRRGLASALLVGTAAMCLLEAPVLLTRSLPGIGAALLVAGVATAPTLIISMQLCSRMVPAAQINEALSLAATGMIIGLALGSSLAGQVIEQLSPHDGYWVPVISAALAVLLALVGRPLMTRRATPASG